MTISTSVQRYTAIKRGLGCKFADREQMLQKYAAFADRHGDEHISCARIVEWAGSAPSMHGSRDRLRVVRSFANSMHAEDDRNEIPPRDVRQGQKTEAAFSHHCRSRYSAHHGNGADLAAGRRSRLIPIII